MIDFTNLPTRKKSYGGANGNKLCVIINDQLYMLKLPSHAPKNINLSYTNSCVSEYLGCHIFNMLGMKAQETILGNYVYNGVNRISVACKDFENNGYKLMDFASVKNQIIDSKSNGYGTDIKDIVETIEKQKIMDPIELSNHFWNMFVIDALIGNWDRHNGNWGFLYNQDTDDAYLAPIFDCGSCLFPQIDEEMIKKVLADKKQLNARIYDFPTSAILINGKRINYYSFIKSHEYIECDKAIERLKPLVNMDSIYSLINKIECITENHKTFLKIIINERFKALFN